MILGIILLGKVFSYYARNLVPGSCQMLGSQPKSWQFMVSSHFLTAAISWIPRCLPFSCLREIKSISVIRGFKCDNCAHATLDIQILTHYTYNYFSRLPWTKGNFKHWNIVLNLEHIISILDIHGRKANASWNIPDITTLKVFNLTASFNLILDFNLVLDRNLVLGSY